MNRNARWIPLAVLMFALLIGQLPRITSGNAFGFLDFDFGYYPAGVAIRNEPSTLYRGVSYDPGTASLEIATPANYVNLPIVAWIFAPFTLFSMKTAGLILLVINGAVCLFSLYLLLEKTDDSRLRWILTLAFASCGPMMNAMNLGQTSPWVLLLLILMDRCLHKGDTNRAGMLLGLMCLLKVPPILILGYFLLRKNWRVAGIAIVTIAGAALVSLILYGPELHREYFDIVFRANAGKAIAAHNSQSIASFLARVTTDASMVSWQPAELPPFVSDLFFLIAAVTLSFAVYFGYREERADLGAGLFLLTALLLFPLCWAHYGMWLLPLFFALCLAVPQRIWILIVAMLLIHIPVLPVWIVRAFNDEMWFRIFVSHMMIGMTMLFLLTLKTIQGRHRPGA